MTIEEKRKYRRLTLGIDDGYFGNFKLGNDESMVAPIVNISAGGLNLAAPAQAGNRLKEGDRLILAGIAGGANFAFLNDIPSEVRWVKQLDTPGYISVGCEFTGIPESVRQQLIKFVDSERMTRGQYGG